MDDELTIMNRKFTSIAFINGWPLFFYHYGASSKLLHSRKFYPFFPNHFTHSQHSVIPDYGAVRPPVRVAVVIVVDTRVIVNKVRWDVVLNPGNQFGLTFDIATTRRVNLARCLDHHWSEIRLRKRRRCTCAVYTVYLFEMYCTAT